MDRSVIALACALMFSAALIAGLLLALSTTGKSMLKALRDLSPDRLEQCCAPNSDDLGFHKINSRIYPIRLCQKLKI